MGREIPYDENLKCDICGQLGAMDFMGDYICVGCLICDKDGNVIGTKDKE